MVEDSDWPSGKVLWDRYLNIKKEIRTKINIYLPSRINLTPREKNYSIISSWNISGKKSKLINPLVKWFSIIDNHFAHCIDDDSSWGAAAESLHSVDDLKKMSGHKKLWLTHHDLGNNLIGQFKNFMAMNFKIQRPNFWVKIWPPSKKIGPWIFFTKVCTIRVYNNQFSAWTFQKN